MKKLYLCEKCSGCPTVEIGEEYVRIGEGENMCTLKKEEWNVLVEKIKSDDL